MEEWYGQLLRKEMKEQCERETGAAGGQLERNSSGGRSQ